MPDQIFHFHVQPLGANLEKAALEFTGIDPSTSARRRGREGGAHRDLQGGAQGHEGERLRSRHHRRPQCHLRSRFRDGRRRAGRPQRNPFHPFATFDTAALRPGLGQTVLAKACQSANIPFDNKEAHPPSTTPSAPPSCSAISSTAGRVWGAGPCHPGMTAATTPGSESPDLPDRLPDGSLSALQGPIGVNRLVGRRRSPGTGLPATLCHKMLPMAGIRRFFLDICPVFTANQLPHSDRQQYKP